MSWLTKYSEDARCWTTMNFSDEASISAYLNNAEEIYSCYNDSKAVTQSGGGRMVPIILFLLAAAAAAGSGYFLYWYFLSV